MQTLDQLLETAAALQPGDNEARLLVRARQLDRAHADIRDAVGPLQSAWTFGAGQAGQLQQAAHHLLHLAFGGAAVAHHGFFHLQRGVFGHRQTGGGQRRQRGTARLAQLERRVRALADEHLLGPYPVVGGQCGAQSGGLRIGIEPQGVGRLGADGID